MRLEAGAGGRVRELCQRRPAGGFTAPTDNV